MITSLPQWTGLDQNDLNATLAPVTAPTSSPTEHDHDSHDDKDSASQFTLFYVSFCLIFIFSLQ